ncbi:P2X purinoceptor 4-like, partial [Acipenser oxyrinchus oxyrinchus]
LSSGIPTGQCVEFNSSVKTCEVFAWCPIEGTRNASKPAILESAENFTVFIKNKI